MANEEQVALLRGNVEAWNAWRQAHPEIRPDLSWVNLNRADLRGANLYGASLGMAGLGLANLREANLERADLRSAILMEADLRAADLRAADLTSAVLMGADLREAVLEGAVLSYAHLDGANLQAADLSHATLVETSLVGATLDGCDVYGVSAWNVELDGANQSDLRLTRWDTATIRADTLSLAQFLALWLNHRELRAVIDTPTSTMVLLLAHSSHSDKRKPVLDAIRTALRVHGYVPVLFDLYPIVFDVENDANMATIEAVPLLARLARFVVADLADLTDSGSVLYELATIVPNAHVPVQPLLLAGASTTDMSGDLWHAREMLPIYRYTTPEEVLAVLPERVIVPTEAKVEEIQRELATALLRYSPPSQ